jgi:polysaccharide pyruvyl transferase WcaK-like protein
LPAKLLARYILNSGKKIYVRDGNSCRNVSSIFGLYAYETADIVFGVDILATYNKTNKALLGITSYQRIKYYGLYEEGEEAYFNHLYSRVLELQKKYENISCVYSDHQDKAACKAFSDYCEERYSNRIDIEKYEELNEMVACIGAAMYIESPRMHTCILGILMGLTVKPVVISPKMQAFFDKYMSNKFSVMELRNSVIESLHDMLSEQEKNNWKNPEQEGLC